MSKESEERATQTPLDEVLDLFVYAPVGLALTAVEELPRMVERGREALEAQLGSARVMGRVAVTQGRVELARIASQWQDLSKIMRSQKSATPRRSDNGGPAPLTSATPPRPRPSPPAQRRQPPAPPDLGIAGYESLSASQVVSRLDGLTPEQRGAVKRYETETRGRRTILGRIGQLESVPAG